MNNHKYLTRLQVEHIADLAKLELDENEIQKFQSQLSQIIDYFHILDEIDIGDYKDDLPAEEVEKISRSDISKESLPIDSALSGTSEIINNQFKVNTIIPNTNEP